MSTTPAPLPENPSEFDDDDSASSSPADPGSGFSRAALTHHLALLVLVTFVFTFVIARILVILIMAGKLPPGLFFHVKGTHVHHLNYGIFLLSFSGAYLIFSRPMGRKLSAATVIYGIGLALTFDEFGMWLHLGGPYWQRASFDAVITIAALLLLIAYGSTLRHWRPRHRITVAAMVVLLCLFGGLWKHSLKWADESMVPKLYHLEMEGPS